MKTKTNKLIQPAIPSINETKLKPVKIILNRLKLCFMLFIIYLVLNLFHFGCPIKGLTGISCPGCGMTRAVRAAFMLDFKAAFYYHPLFMITPIMFLLFLFDSFLPSKPQKIIWSIIIVLFLITYLYRLFFTQSDVVQIDIWSGLVLKLFHNIIGVGGFK
ncbi:MAG TPA: DUF2752 domain-containing protein [Mobilitalea sp.]|nr:DUF2752 domain-containing protein [Mobilitalea sp.]